MKKLLLGLGILLLLLGVLVFRALTVFEEQQVEAQAGSPLPEIDMPGATRRLSEALRYPTVSFDDPERLDQEAFRGLREHMAASFPRVHAQGEPRLVSEHSLLYRIEGNDSSLKPALFMGHIDVVPVDDATLDQWRFPPFDGVVENGIIWGRGAMDDKVTVFALLEAMELLLAEGLQPSRTLYFAFGHDEEVGGPRGAAQIARLLADENVSFEFVLDEGGVLTEGMLAGVDAPVALVGIAEKGFVNLRLTVSAEGGHSSQPPDHTAAGILSAAIVALESAPFATNLEYTKQTIDAIGSHTDFTTRFFMANLWLFEPVISRVMLNQSSSAALIRSTIAATMLEGSSKSNILPTRATAVVNVRIMPGETIASVKQHFIRAINDSRVEVSTFMENEPSAVSPTDSTGYRLIEKNIRAMDDSVLVAPYLVIGGTDSKHFYALSPNIYRFIMVRADPDGLQRIHGVNEQLPVADYEMAIQFFYRLLKDSAGS